MMDDLIKPLHIICYEIEYHSQLLFFSPDMSSRRAFLHPSLIWAAVLFHCSVRGTTGTCAAVTAGCYCTPQGAHSSPSLPLGNLNSLSSIEQNCWTVSCNALLSSSAVTHWFWFLPCQFACVCRHSLESERDGDHRESGGMPAACVGSVFPLCEQQGCDNADTPH